MGEQNTLSYDILTSILASSCSELPTSTAPTSLVLLLEPRTRWSKPSSSARHWPVMGWWRFPGGGVLQGHLGKSFPPKPNMFSKELQCSNWLHLLRVISNTAIVWSSPKVRIWDNPVLGKSLSPQMFSGMWDTRLFAKVRNQGGEDDRNRKRVSEDGSVWMQGWRRAFQTTKLTFWEERERRWTDEKNQLLWENFMNWKNSLWQGRLTKWASKSSLKLLVMSPVFRGFLPHSLLDNAFPAVSLIGMNSLLPRWLLKAPRAFGSPLPPENLILPNE